MRTSAVASLRAPRRPRFRHEILEHGDGVAGFVRDTAPRVRRALDRQEAVLVVVREDRMVALREELGAEAERVGFSDARKLGSNPARIIPAWQRFLEQRCDDHAGGALGIGEPVWPGRAEQELEECMRHEMLVNLAFGGGRRSWLLVCPYDLDGLDDDVIERARGCHPFQEEVRTGAAGLLDGTLPEPLGEVLELAFAEGDLGTLRRTVLSWACAHALSAERAQELVLAVNELAGNSVLYGGGGGTAHMWLEAGTLMCEVRDSGRISDPLVGRVRATEDWECGRGLWIVNQVCDLVQIRSSAGSTAVRVHKVLSS